MKELFEKNTNFLLNTLPVITKNDKLIKKAVTEQNNQCLRRHDKTDWPDGPWRYEIDYEEWIDPGTGYLCLIGRNPSPAGSFCGYVGIPKNHLLYGKDPSAEIIDNIDIEVHGGITYGGNTAVLLLGLEKRWWIGFDCGHYGDICPLMFNFEEREATYKDINYVKRECEKLAKQLKKYEGKETRNEKE